MQGLNILIFDNDNLSRAKTIAAAFQNQDACARVYYGDVFYKSSGERDDPSVAQWDLVLLHKSNQSAFELTKIQGRVILTFTGGGSGDIPDNLPEDAAAHICRVFNDEAISDKKEGILSYWRREPRLAFRFLCEARLACGNDRDYDPNCNGTGLTIHAPKDIGQWLVPFGENLTETDFPKVAGIIGSGDVKKAAEDVLKAVSQKQDLSRAIADFLKADKSQNP